METSASHGPEPIRTPADDLTVADGARREFAGSLQVPRGYDLTAGIGAGLFVAAEGLIWHGGSAWRQLVGAAMFLLGAAALGWSVRRFRDLNGAWVSGLRAGATRRVAMIGGAVQAGLMVAAIVAVAAAGWWWFSFVLAPIGVVSFIVGSRWWMTVYRTEHGFIS